MKNGVRVLTMYPPNFKAINEAFQVRGKPIIYAYGDVIYNPSRIVIPPELFAHEAVHQRYQCISPDVWWERYIADMDFRLTQEIYAHRAEYRDISSRLSGKARSRAMHSIAERLSSPLYGSMLSLETAINMIEPYGAGDTRGL